MDLNCTELVETNIIATPMLSFLLRLVMNSFEFILADFAILGAKSESIAITEVSSIYELN